MTFAKLADAMWRAGRDRRHGLRRPVAAYARLVRLTPEPWPFTDRVVAA